MKWFKIRIISFFGSILNLRCKAVSENRARMEVRKLYPGCVITTMEERKSK
jgi:hypothetical protein